MRNFAAIAAVCATAFFANVPAAHADKFNVSANLEYGGTLTGYFVTNSNFSTVTSYDLVASAGPGAPGFTFPGYTYTETDSSITAETKKMIQFDFMSGTDELRLVFTAALNSSGATLSTSSYESEITAGNRYVTSGTVTPAAATPEPSSIALLGTGLLGVAGVLRKRFA